MSECPYAAALAAEPQMHYRALPPLSWDSAWQCWVAATPQWVRKRCSMPIRRAAGR